MTRIGIVGSGGMAAERARSFSAMSATRVVGVHARNLEKAEALSGLIHATAFEHFEQMLSEVDAVVVCIPNVLHTACARQALLAGKHVLVEYPLCTNLDDAEALRALAADSGRVLMVGNTIIHEAMFRYLMKHRQRVGTLLSAASRVALYDEGNLAWYLNAETTGPVFAAFHYHHIEYYRRFLGEVEWVLARDESRSLQGYGNRDESLPVPDQSGHNVISGGTLIMGHRGGATSCVQWYLSAQGSGLCRGLWINGSKSSVTIVSREPTRSLVVWDGGGEGKEEVYDDEWGVAGSCQDFIDAIEGRLNHAVRLQSDVETMRVGLLATRSAERGEMLRVGQRQM